MILVDDDFIFRQAIGRLLRSNGFGVIAFERPSDVLLSSLPRSAACLMIDVNMPEMHGVELCHALEAKGIRLPTILITGYPGQHVETYAEEVGAVALLFKPLEATELFHAIETALKQSVA